MSHAKSPVLKVVPATAPELEKKLAKKEENVRRRAYELYCEGTQRDALSNWLRAEHEMEMLMCTGIEEDKNTFHIESGLPEKPTQLNVSALPDAVVVDGSDNTKYPFKLTVLHMPSLIRPETVKGWLEHGVLEITVEKLAAGKSTAPDGNRPFVASAA